MAITTRPGFFRYWLGRYHLRMGYCPACNSSPPRLDCLVCHGARQYGPSITPLDQLRWRNRWDAQRNRLH